MINDINHKTYLIMKYVSLFIILLAFFACADEAKKSDKKDSTTDAAGFCSRIPAGSMDSFFRYDFDPEWGWSRQNPKSIYKGMWIYSIKTDGLLILQGFSELNRDMHLPLAIPDSATVLLKYSSGKDSLRILDGADPTLLIASLSLNITDRDPLKFFRQIENRRTEAGIIGLLHNDYNNIVEVVFSPENQFFYVPDPVTNYYGKYRDTLLVDSVSVNVLRYIEQNDILITNNCYRKDVSKGI